MIRTQIYLDKDQYEGVKLRAKITGKSSAEVIRGLIEIGLSPAPSQTVVNHKFSDLSKLNIRGGPKDLANKIDAYLYEQG